MKINFLLKVTLTFLLVIQSFVGIAQDYNPTHIYKIIHVLTGKVLEVGGDDRYANDHAINVWDYWGGANQQWHLKKTGDYYQIINRNSRLLLTLTGSDFPSVATYPSWLISQKYEGDIKYKSEQEWKIKAIANSSNFRIYSPSIYGNLAKLIARPADLLVICASAAPDYWNEWTIVDVSTNQDVYQVTNVLSGKALSATANGDNRVSQWTNWGLAGQQWYFSPAGNDPLYPGHQLWAVHARTDLGTLEIGGSYNETLQAGRGANTWGFWNRDLNSSNQLWRILDDNNNDLSLNGSIGPYRLLNVRTGYALEVSGSSSEALREDRPVVQYYYWGGDKQKWYISYAATNRPANPGTVTSTSSVKTKESLFTLAPNPARNQLTLALSNGKMPVKVELIDAKGSTYSLSVQAGGQIDISSLPAGLYVLRAFNGLQTLQSKFIKE